MSRNFRCEGIAMKQLLCLVIFVISALSVTVHAETVANAGILTLHIYTSADDDTVAEVKSSVGEAIEQKGIEATKMDMVFLLYRSNEKKADKVMGDVKEAVDEAMVDYQGGQILISWILAAYGNIYTGYATFE